jgi:hypothetical protein
MRSHGTSPWAMAISVLGSVAILLAALVAVGLFSGSASAQAPQDDELVGRPGVRSLLLTPGWNPVTWTGADGLDHALSSLRGPFSVLAGFDAENNQFLLHRGDDAPAFLNTLPNVAFGDGLLIFVDEEVIWEQAQIVRDRTVPLAPGLNLVGWTGGNNTPIEAALAGISDSIEFVGRQDGEEFLVHRPEGPAFINSLPVLNYGDAVWVSATQARDWDQAAPRIVHTQDVWFFTKLTRRDAAGIETDFLQELQEGLAANLSDPVRLDGLGGQFQEAPGLTGHATDEDGVPLTNIDLTFGLLQDGAPGRDGDGRIVSGPLAPLLFRNASTILMGFGSPEIQDTDVNFDLDDLVVLDTSAIDSVQVGDTIIAELVFAQVLPGDVVAESGASALEIFNQRVLQGHVRIAGDLNQDGELDARVLTLELPVTESAALPAIADLVSAQAGVGTALQYGAKIVVSAIAGISFAGIEFFSFGSATPFVIGGVTFVATAVINEAPNLDDPPPPTPLDTTKPVLFLLPLSQSSGSEAGTRDAMISARDDRGIDVQFTPTIEAPAGVTFTNVVKNAFSNWISRQLTFQNTTEESQTVRILATARDLAGNVASQAFSLTVPPRAPADTTPPAIILETVVLDSGPARGLLMVTVSAVDDTAIDAGFSPTVEELPDGVSLVSSVRTTPSADTVVWEFEFSNTNLGSQTVTIQASASDLAGIESSETFSFSVPGRPLQVMATTDHFDTGGAGPFTVFFTVTFVDASTGLPLNGLSVSGTITGPATSTATRTTHADGVITFSVDGGEGTYVLTLGEARFQGALVTVTGGNTQHQAVAILPP